MKKFISGLLAMLCVIAISGCANKQTTSTNEKEVTLVLDYLPYTNHTGIYVAQKNGYFKEEGLKVNIIEPGDNNTSAALVAAGKGQFGVSYQEDVTYALTAQDPMPIKAIATIIQHNTSGFVALKDSGITGYPEITSLILLNRINNLVR